VAPPSPAPVGVGNSLTHAVPASAEVCLLPGASYVSSLISLCLCTKAGPVAPPSPAPVGVRQLSDPRGPCICGGSFTRFFASFSLRPNVHKAGKKPAKKKKKKNSKEVEFVPPPSPAPLIVGNSPTHAAPLSAEVCSLPVASNVSPLISLCLCAKAGPVAPPSPAPVSVCNSLTHAAPASAAVCLLPGASYVSPHNFFVFALRPGRWRPPRLRRLVSATL
jgi:hypothetical protein